MSFGKQESSSSGTSTANPWAPAQSYLEQALGQAGDIYSEGIKQDTSYLKDIQDRYSGILSGDMNISSEDKLKRAQEYVNPDMVASIQDQNQQLLNSTLMGNTASQLSAGNANSSRSALAEASAIQNQSQQMNQQLLDYQNQQLDRATSDLESERDLALSASEGLNQALRDESMADYFNNSADRDAFSQYLNSILAIGGMGGTTTTSGNQSGKSMGADGALGALFMSDETLKKDKKKTGRKIKVDGTDKTVDEYEYKPTKEGEKLGMPKGKTRGVMAQDVEKVSPENVKKTKSGKKAVNYGALSVKGGK